MQKKLETFGLCSGLCVNHEKTEILAIGNISLQEREFAQHNLCQAIKILGVFLGMMKNK